MWEDPTLAAMMPPRRWGTRGRGWGDLCVPTHRDETAMDGAPER